MRLAAISLLIVCAACANRPRIQNKPPGCPSCHPAPSDPRAVMVPSLFELRDARGLEELAGDGVPEAQLALSLCLASGEGARPDRRASLDMLRSAAFLDHAPAQHAMGLRYATGDGVERDPRQAVRWFEMAANKRYGPAMLDLADFCAAGTGVERDVDQARAWLKKLAAHERCDLAGQARERLAGIEELNGAE